MLNNERRGPIDFRRPVHFPAVLAGLGVEPEYERIALAFHRHDDHVTVQNRRLRSTDMIGHFWVIRIQRADPKDIAGRIQSNSVPSREYAIDRFAVGHWRRACHASLGMTERLSRGEELSLPQFFARLSVKAK